MYRINFSNSPGYIRQYIKHKGVLINNKLITSPSYQLKLSDTLSFDNKLFVYERLYLNFIKKIVFMSIPSYYEVNFRTLQLKFCKVPSIDTIFYPFIVDKLRLASSGQHF